MSIASCCECCASITNLYDSSEEHAITILNCFAMQIEMGKGKLICQICIEKLNEANEFRNLILNTQEVLRNHKDNNILCNDVAEIELTPKEEYYVNFEMLDDFDDYLETSPLKKECDTSEKSFQNSLVFDILKKSTDLVIKPITKTVARPVTKPAINNAEKIVLKPKGKTVIKKLTKAQAMNTYSFPIIQNKSITNADNIRIQDTLRSKQVNKISKSSMIMDQKYRNDDFIMPKLDDKDFICHECQKQFVSFKSLSVHMNDHYRNYICENCGKGFATKRRLDTHVNTHSVTKSICKECGKEFNSASYLMSHIQRTHDRVKPNRCQICGEKFLYYVTKVKHMSEVHGQTPRKHKCVHCPMEFLIGAELTMHIRRKHTMCRERRHFCETCGDGFFTKNALRNHMLKHTGSRDFKCHLCPKAYPRKFTLREHMRIHENDKRFKCEVCGQAFTQKCTLKGHMKVHEKQSGNR